MYDVEELASAVQRYRDDIVTKRLAFAGLLSATAGLSSDWPIPGRDCC